MDKYFDPYKWTIDLRQEIIEKTQLPISFALATNKLIAKIATNEAKPNGFIQVPPGFEKQYLAPLKVGKIPGVGEQLTQTLAALGINTIEDLSNYGEKPLEKKFGKYGIELWNKSQGVHT